MYFCCIIFGVHRFSRCIIFMYIICCLVRILYCIICFFFLMIRRPPRSTRTDPSFPTRRSYDLTQAATGVQTSTEAGISVNRTSTLGINPADGSHGLIDAGLGISYEVDVVGRTRRTIEVSATNAQAQAGAYDLARTTVAAGVEGASRYTSTAGAWLAVARCSALLHPPAPHPPYPLPLPPHSASIPQTVPTA